MPALLKLEKILQKEMTRKQFMLALASGVVGLLGISTFLGAFTRETTKPAEDTGYGDRHYGP